MGVRANADLPSGADELITMIEPAADHTVRIEVLNASGLDALANHANQYSAGLELGTDELAFRAAVTVCGQVVYAATGMRTQNPVRLGGLPRGTDLAIGILPPLPPSVSDTGAAKPLLLTAPLALAGMQACAKPPPASYGAPDRSLLWEGWLTLNLCNSNGNLDEAQFPEPKIQVSVLIEEATGQKPSLAIAKPALIQAVSEDSQRPDVSSNVSQLTTSCNDGSDSPQFSVKQSDVVSTPAGSVSASSSKEPAPLPTVVQHAPGTSLARSFADISASAVFQGTPCSDSSPDVSASLRHHAVSPALPVLQPESPASPPTPGSLADKSSREVLLELENERLRSELQQSQQELVSTRSELQGCRQELNNSYSHHQEDRLRVEEKLKELEVEVRTRWQERVAELEQEVIFLRTSLTSRGGQQSVSSRLGATAPQAAMDDRSPAGQSQLKELCDASPLEVAGASRSSESSRLSSSYALHSAASIRSPETIRAQPLPMTSMTQFPHVAPDWQAASAGWLPSADGRFHCSTVGPGPPCAYAQPSIGGLKPPPGLRVAGLGPVPITLPAGPTTPDFSFNSADVGPSSNAGIVTPPKTHLRPSPCIGSSETPSDAEPMRHLRALYGDGHDGHVAREGTGPIPLEALAALATAPHTPAQSSSRPPSPPKGSSPSQARQVPLQVLPGSAFREATSSSGDHQAEARRVAAHTKEAGIPHGASGGGLGSRLSTKSRSSSVPIAARGLEGEEPGVVSFLEAFGGFFSTQLLQGTKCTGPDALAINERLVEIDLSHEFPPERRAAQVDLQSQMPHKYKIHATRAAWI